MYESNDRRLTFVPAGEASTAEAQVFARSEELGRLISAVRRTSDRIVFDLPPLLGPSPSPVLVRHADAVVLVVRHGVTTEAQVSAALKRVDDVPVAGVVFNRVTSRIPGLVRRRLANW
jgi:tyrosine-protein kinase Etk/Wzc